jgi:hypothetical protein
VAILPQPKRDVYAQIRPEDAKEALRTGKWSDDAALSIVVNDTLKAENFEIQKAWILAWPVAATLYQSPYSPRYWEGTQSERANVPFYTLANAVNSLIPTIMSGLFADSPPFMVQPRPGTREQTARAIQDLQNFQLEDIGFREEIRLGATNTVLFGTGLWKWGWESFSKARKMYQRKKPPLVLKNPLSAAGMPDIKISDGDDIEEVVVDEQIDRPFFEHIPNCRQVLVAPTLQVPDIRKAKYVVHRLYLTWDDLDKLRDRPGYNIPPRQELLDLFFPPKEPVEQSPEEMTARNAMWDARSESRSEADTVDPFNQPLEVLERWDDETCIAVLQKKLVIANDDNPYGVIPFLSCGWWDVPEAFWSLGLGKTIGAEQRLQQGITNIWLDQASLNLNGIYIRVKGKSIPTQSIRMAPGKIVEVDTKGDFEPLPRQPAVPEAGEHLSLSAARVERSSGSTDVGTMGIGGPTAHSNLGRSAAGASLIGAGAGNRPADFVDKLADKVIIPFLYAVHEMNRALLPIETIEHILGDELQHEFVQSGGDVLEILNARLKFSVLAGSRMTAKRNMAQALPLLTQFLTSPEVTTQLGIAADKVDIRELVHMYFQVSDWRNFNDVIVPMGDEDKKRWQMMQPGAQAQTKLAVANQLQQQKFQQEQKLLDDGNYARAGRDVLREALKRSASPEAITGEPGGTGFGSQF